MITVGLILQSMNFRPTLLRRRVAALAKSKMSFLSYFRSPFPSREGFSAYRMPGAAVHGPLILAFSLVGFFLCWPHTTLRPLFVVWILAGVYLGRDITIRCHYYPLLTFIAWGASAMVLFRPAQIQRFGASHAVLSTALSMAVGAVLLSVAFVISREKD